MFSMTSQTRFDEVGQTVFDVKIVGDNGEEKNRSLYLDDYISLLKLSKEVKDDTSVLIPSGFIPEDAILSYFSNEQTFDFLFRVKGSKRLVMYSCLDGVKGYEVPFPDLIFRLRVRDGYVRLKQCFATLPEDEHLYVYPFGNVSDGGEICMGSIDLHSVTPKSFVENFFLGVTNDDYWNRQGRINLSCDWSQRKLLEELSKREEYPTEWLVKSSGMTLDLLKQRVHSVHS